MAAEHGVNNRRRFRYIRGEGLVMADAMGIRTQGTAGQKLQTHPHQGRAIIFEWLFGKPFTKSGGFLGGRVGMWSLPNLTGQGLQGQFELQGNRQ